jgi:hypothetical protein
MNCPALSSIQVFQCLAHCRVNCAGIVFGKDCLQAGFEFRREF